MKGTAIAYALSFASMGCASVTVKSATPDTVPEEGIIYYEPMTVMVVACTKEGGRTLEFKTVPNYERPRVITWNEGMFGSAKPNVTLAEGWRLDAFSTEITSPGADVLSLAGKLGEATIGALDRGEKAEAAGIEPGIYSIPRKQNSDWKDLRLVGFGACIQKAEGNASNSRGNGTSGQGGATGQSTTTGQGAATTPEAAPGPKP